MERRMTAVPVVCALCATPFTLTPHAHTRRIARYGDRLLCVRCLTDSWLRTRAGQYQQERVLHDARGHPDEANHPAE